MYNEELKMKFINDLPESSEQLYKKNLINLFNRLADTSENDIKEDFCEMSYDDAKYALAKLGGRSFKTLSWNLSRLKTYNEWCIINGHSSRDVNSLLGVKVNDIDTSLIYRREMIKSPETLSDILKTVYPEIYEDRESNIHMMYILLLYNGLTENEAVRLEKRSIDLVNGYILSDNNKIPMLNGTYELAERIINMNFFKVKRFGRDILLRPYDSGLLLNTTRKTPVSPKRQYNYQVSKMNETYREKTGRYIKITPLRIYESGIYNIWLNIEKSGSEIDYNEYVIKKTCGKIYQNKQEQTFNKIKKQVIIEYNMWKKAFNL